MYLGLEHAMFKTTARTSAVMAFPRCEVLTMVTVENDQDGIDDWRRPNKATQANACKQSLVDFRQTIGTMQ